jgi:ribosome-binding protein aMBF1 (putative translation factor)
LKGEKMFKIYCDICGKEVPNEEACRVAVTIGAYTPGKDGTTEERRDSCRDCTKHLLAVMTNKPKDTYANEPTQKKPVLANRCITIARHRAGMTQEDLAKQVYYDTHVVSSWEQGRSEVNWELLYKVLPELPQIRKNGCSAYCDHTTACLTGDCYYARKRKMKKPDAG